MSLKLNPKVLNTEPSGIRQIFNKLSQYPDAIDLTVGQSDFETPDHVKQAAITSIKEGYNNYSANKGLIELRQEVVNFYQSTYGLQYDLEEVIVTNGASEALDITFRTLLEPGDEVILLSPTYPGYIPLIELSGAKPVVVDTGNNSFKPTIDQLQAVVTDRTKAILLNYPSNPTGVVLSDEETRELSDWLMDQDFFVISDEIYSEITFNNPHRSIVKDSDLKEKTILINGLSKSHSMTGWRIGYTLAPAYITDQMEKVHLYNVVCAPITSQFAAIEALKNGRNDPKVMVEEYIERVDFVYKRLKAMGLDVTKPEGAFYIFPKIPANYGNSLKFTLDLLEKGQVAVVPGSAFSSLGEGYFRISYATSLNNLKIAMDRLENFLSGEET